MSEKKKKKVEEKKEDEVKTVEEDAWWNEDNNFTSQDPANLKSPFQSKKKSISDVKSSKKKPKPEV